MKTRALCLLLVASSGLFAQTPDTLDTKKSIHTGSINAGLILSEGYVTGSLYTTYAVKTGSWETGVGAGMDGFDNWRFYPVFLSLSKAIYQGQNSALFVQVNCGHAWAKSKEQIISWSGPPDETETRGGYSQQILFGYRFTDRKVRTTLSLGHKLQKGVYRYRYNYWDNSYQETTIERTFSGFVMVVGIGF